MNGNTEEVVEAATVMMKKIGDAFVELPDNMQTRKVFATMHKAMFEFLDVVYLGRIEG